MRINADYVLDVIHSEHLSVKEFASLCGLSTKTVYNAINGCSITKTTVDKMRFYIGCPAEDILEGTDVC